MCRWIHPLFSTEWCPPMLLPGWLAMLVISLSILFALKSIVLVDYFRHAATRPRVRAVAMWFLAWPGLNARDFFNRLATSSLSVPLGEWFFATVKCLFGVVCIVWPVPAVADWNRLAAGWLAMFGLLMLFHFGGFHLLALAWRMNGRSVQPLMHRPLLATSVNDFWSRRWNLAFRDFATQFVMRPLARRWSAQVGLWGCFVFSGLVHELAISVPARSGFGLPLGYFVLQALGVSIERSAIGKRIGFSHGWQGWLFAFLLIGPPAFMLFHPPFLTRVVLPLVGLP